MECSPTLTCNSHWIFSIVAVPVNYGMLSYLKNTLKILPFASRSPRQLWNALLLGLNFTRLHNTVAVPVNYGMLSYHLGFMEKINILVAVPVNYGMLSYSVVDLQNYPKGCRSPRQLWNALLRLESKWNC